MRNKKGGVESKIVYFVLFLVILAIMVFMVQTIGKGGERTGRGMDCYSSVAAHAMDKNVDINCPREDITIPTKEAIKPMLADAMYRCWHDFHKGRKDLMIISGRYCSVCSFIEFKEKTKEPITDFNEYLNKTFIPGKDMTYSQYLEGYAKGKLAADVPIPLYTKYKTLLDIDTTKDYGVIFFYAKGDDKITRLSKRTLGDFVTKFVLGLEPKYAAYVVLRPYDTTELAGLGCVQLVGKKTK